MKNYYNLLLESDRKYLMFTILRGTKFGFIANIMFVVCFYLFIVYGLFGASPDTFTIYSLLVFMISPVKNADTLLIPSLPLTKKELQKWNLRIHCLYLVILLPFSFILYFIPSMNTTDSWAVAGTPSILTIAVGSTTGIILSVLVRIVIDSGLLDCNLLGFIKSNNLRVMAYLLMIALSVYGMHYLNIWLINLF